LDAKWYVSSARLKKNSDETLKKIVVFTYDLELLGTCIEKIYQVIEELDFLKKILGKASLLTKREIEIIKLLAKGKTSSEIGNVLFISNHTGNTHRKNIYKKPKTNNIAEVI